MLDDTIAAVATPPGEGGIAIVRVSGPRAAGVAASVLRGPHGGPRPLRKGGVHLGVVADPQTGRAVDEVLALWLPAPNSYTREDVLELQCHGGQAAARGVLDVVLRCGVRLAEPGEFTLRAYLRGRIDLVQAEAVLDTIRAQSADALRVHEELLEGKLSRQVERWQEALGGVLTQVEAQLDFPEEEDLGALAVGAVLQELEAISRAMGDKLASFSWGRVCREGFRVVLTGAPNTGKSSLLNCLAEEDRAIVSPVPGTTRDAIDVCVNARGAAVWIVDTAGLRTGGDEVEEEGVRRARRTAACADLVVLVCDGSRPLLPEETEDARRLAGERRALAVVNKADLGLVPRPELGAIFGQDPLTTSAVTGEGIEDLRLALRNAAWGGTGPSAAAPLTRIRHTKAVEAARAGVERARTLIREGELLEVAATEIHGARRQLRELLGWGTPEDVLNQIFSEFCIGK